MLGNGDYVCWDKDLTAYERETRKKADGSVNKISPDCSSGSAT